MSLLPSATEIVAALGREDSLVGRSHECDWPPSAARVPVVTSSSSKLDGMTSGEIDRAVSQSAPGELYGLEEEAIAGLRPDLLITQELCGVCAIPLDRVHALADRLPGAPDVLSLAPETLEGVLASIVAIGGTIGAEQAARALVDELRARLERVERGVSKLPPVRTIVLEWLDPLYACGHWVPDQVARAGGVELLGRAGQASFRVEPGDITAARPELVVLAPCGHRPEQVASNPEALRFAVSEVVGSARVVVVDANAQFSRPGPRLVDGVEVLAALMHPDAGLPAAPPPPPLVLAPVP